jgi:hypothetical protein
MNMPTPRLTPRSGLVAALVLLSAGSATASSVQYLVTVNTSPVNTTSGFLDFQFNPGDASSQSATAQIMNFNSGGGTLVFNLGSPQASLSVSGTLPDTVTLVNATAVNDYFQEFTYGDFFSFVLSLTGPALDSPDGTATAGTTFGILLLDGQNSILTNNSAGVSGQVLVNLDGSTTPQSFPTATGGPSVVTFQELPEPGTMFLLGIGSLALTVLRLRLRRTRC